MAKFINASNYSEGQKLALRGRAGDSVAYILVLYKDQTKLAEDPDDLSRIYRVFNTR